MEYGVCGGAELAEAAASAGFDFQEIANITPSLQFIEQRILGYEEAITSDKSNKIMTLRLSTDFLSETLGLSGIALHNLNGEGTIFRIQSDYDVMDGVGLIFGADFIEGEADNFFGQFRDNDLVYFKMKYSF